MCVSNSCKPVSYTHLDVYKRQASKGTRLKFYKVMALPTLLYGSEYWVLTKGQASRIQAAGMRFLRHVAGYLSLIHI